MCRNIKPLFHLEPAASAEEIRLAALQYVRKVSGYRQPSRLNDAVFNQAVDAVAQTTQTLLNALQTQSALRLR